MACQSGNDASGYVGPQNCFHCTASYTSACAQLGLGNESKGAVCSFTSPSGASISCGANNTTTLQRSIIFSIQWELMPGKERPGLTATARFKTRRQNHGQHPSHCFPSPHSVDVGSENRAPSHLNTASQRGHVGRINRATCMPCTLPPLQCCTRGTFWFGKTDSDFILARREAGLMDFTAHMSSLAPPSTRHHFGAWELRLDLLRRSRITRTSHLNQPISPRT